MGQSSSSLPHPLIGHHSGRIEPYETTTSEEDFDYIHYLPDECIALIFQKVGKGDRNSCSLVCKRWHLIESKSRQRLALVAQNGLSCFLSSLVTRFESVTVLALKCSRKLRSIDDKTLTLLGKSFVSLKKIKLKGCMEITDDGLESFSLVCAPLKKFSCGSCRFGAKGLNAILKNCKGLEDLTVKRLKRLDVQTERIGPGHGKLLRLCLKDLHNGQLFGPLLSGSKNLKTLILSRNSGYWDQMLDTITESLGQLIELQIENMQLGDRGLNAIAKCSKLEVFYISRVSDITNFGISAVANGCRRMRKVHLDSWKTRRIGDEGIVSLATKCTQLQEIVLISIDVTICSLNAMASNCPGLERMALCNSESVGDEELSCISARFVGLKKLCIKNCAITDDGLERLALGCPNLIKLKVKRCKHVTSRSVFHLQRCRSSLLVSLDHGGAHASTEDENISSLVSDENRVIREPTHVLCGSRTPLIKSRLGVVASNFLRRSASSSPRPSSSS